MKNIDSDLIRGNIDTIILKTLLDGDKYGLDIIKEVDERSNGTYELKQPTLYSCLKRLENQGLISSYWLDSEIGGRRHYYKLTEHGHESLRAKQEEWAKSKFIIDNLLSNYNYDEYRLVKKDDYDKIIEGKQTEYTEKELSTPVEELEETQVDEPQENEETQELDESEDDFEEPVQETSAEIRDESADDDENKKFGGYKFSSVYDNINIDGYDTTPVQDEEDSDEVSFVETDDEETEEDDFIAEINEYTSLLDYDEDEELDNQEDDEQTEYSGFDEDGFDDEDDSLEELESSSHVYVSQENEETEEDDEPAVTYELADQTQNEQNILSLLRRQQDEEINEYVGDKQSYINHLNTEEETAVQQNLLLDDESLTANTVDDKINDFASAIKELNNFSSSSSAVKEDFNEKTEEIEPEEADSFEPEVSDDFYAEPVFEDNFLSELDELKSDETNGYWDSTDVATYAENTKHVEPQIPDFATSDDEEENACGCTDTGLDSFTFTSEHAEVTFNGDEDDDDEYEREFSHKEISFEQVDEDIETSFASFDEIISKNANDYTSDNTELRNSEEYQTLKPSYTSGNYKQKLSHLSAYSKVSTEEQVTANKQPSEATLAKVKDINALKEDFENEGIKVKEYKKIGAHDEAEKNYLLINKLNLVKSLILLFGYVFVLSAVYIIMHTTGGKNIYDFSFKYFVFGMIPFIVYAGYYTVLFVINPYKKVTAKYAPRIMIFIAVIITVQLLLITYCVNLQLGFYSFTQQFYNHLLWVIPTIISFAPIFVTIIHISLFYSKNFNV